MTGINFLCQRISLKFKISSPVNDLTWRCTAIKVSFQFHIHMYDEEETRG